jgi:glutamate decarboxylase
MASEAVRTTQDLPDIGAGEARAGEEERLLEMFGGSTRSESAEDKIDAQVSRIAREFLGASAVSTDVELRWLMEKCSESRLPDAVSDAEGYVNYLAENIVEHSTHTSSPRFIGHMTSALPYFVRPLGKLMTAMNQNVVKMETARALSLYERQTLAIIHRLIYDEADDFYAQHVQRSTSTLGIMLSGGTLANVTALWCARNAALGPKDDFGGVEREGLAAALAFYGYKSAVVIGSALMHYSIGKAVGLLGLGAGNLVQVPVDRNNRIELDALRETMKTCRERGQLILALVGVAGTTDTGAVDALPELAEIARESGIYFHVDAAWGGPLLFSARHRHRLAGIELADSVTIDGHKQLYAPMGIGMLILRDPHTAKAIEKHARYIVRPNSIDLGKRSLEGSRPAVALFVHASLHILGRRGYEILVDRGIAKAQHMAETIRSRHEFELLVEPQLNILVYRYIPEQWRAQAMSQSLDGLENQEINQVNEQLQKIQRQRGHSFVSRTTLETTVYGRGVPIAALRAVIANPLTGESDIAAVLDEQAAIAADIAAETA